MNLLRSYKKKNTSFESLANELILDLFEFLDFIQILRAFYGLNNRFNQLISNHIRICYVNFQSISKYDFNIICQKHFPLILDRIISLHLSNDDETPNLCELLLSYDLTLDRFIHLKSLSLYHIDSFDTINEIIIQCRHLSYLNHLNIIECSVDDWKNNTIDISNNIWSLSQLTHFKLNDTEVRSQWLSDISVVSLSIEYLSIENINCYENILDHLFKFTPYLRHLHTKITDTDSIYDHDEIILSSMISLKISFEGNEHLMINLFQMMPNLRYLTLKTRNMYLNGYQWEKLIIDYLPNLKNFRLKMTFNISYLNNIEEHVDDLLKSFRTLFWIEERRWFIRYDCYFSNVFKTGIVYTLPYAFEEFFYLKPQYSKSTELDEEDFLSYDRVRGFQQKYSKIDTLDSFNLIITRFPNIHHLEINLPFNDNFDSCIWSLDQLTSLNVTLTNDLGYTHLQVLLDRAHHLYSLKFYSFGQSIIGLFQLTSSSVRRLDLMVAQVQYGRYFNSTDCVHLIKSSLGHLCEVLLIEVKDRRNILHLIERMSNLRMLTFLCKEVMQNYEESLLGKNDFFQWLQRNLSSTFSIITDSEETLKAHVWISRPTKKTLSFKDYSVKSKHRNRFRRFYLCGCSR